MSLTSIIFVTLIAIAIIASDRPHRGVAWLLLAEFSMFIGLDLIINENSLESLWLDPVCGLLSVGFVFGFALLGSTYLASISALIAIYYVSTFVAEVLQAYWYFEYYYLVMLGFSILQIAGLLPGVYHGYIRWKSRDISTHHRDRAGYHRIRI